MCKKYRLSEGSDWDIVGYIAYVRQNSRHKTEVI